jgi:hypothetical protein
MTQLAAGNAPVGLSRPGSLPISGGKRIVTISTNRDEPTNCTTFRSRSRLWTVFVRTYGAGIASFKERE